MPAPVTYTKAKDDPLHRLGLVQAEVACETVGGNYLRFQVLRGTMQYCAVCIFSRDGEDWEIYPYRNGRKLRNPMKNGPTATIVRLNVLHSRAWHQHAAKFNTMPAEERLARLIARGEGHNDDNGMMWERYLYTARLILRHARIVFEK